MHLCKREGSVSNLTQHTTMTKALPVTCRYYGSCPLLVPSAGLLCIERPELTFHPCNSCVSSVVSAGDTLETSGAAGPSTFSAPGHPCIAENHKQSYFFCRKPWAGLGFVQQYQPELSTSQGMPLYWSGHILRTT